MLPGAAALVGPLVLAAAVTAPSPSPRPGLSCAPWGAEPFQSARRQDRPVAVYVRYFACQACDTVERALTRPGSPLAGEYACVKVDADELPVVAAIYRSVAEALDG